jgi:hypothetical protein
VNFSAGTTGTSSHSADAFGPGVVAASKGLATVALGESDADGAGGWEHAATVRAASPRSARLGLRQK